MRYQYLERKYRFRRYIYAVIPALDRLRSITGARELNQVPMAGLADASLARDDDNMTHCSNQH